MRRLPAALLPYAAFGFLTLISWNRWIEPYVDSGRELSAGWRISNGEALYSDVRFYHGPLAPYLAAGVDRLAGPSLPARIGLAGVIALFHLEGLRRLARRALSPARAAGVTAVIVAVAFFLRPGGCHLFPFSFDTAIAAAAIAWALDLAAGRSSGEGDLPAALCLVAALLSRPEMGLVTIAALAYEVKPVRRLATLAAVPVVVAGVPYALLSAGTPFRTLRHEGWLALLGPPAAFRNIYSSYAGLDRPALRLAELALAGVVLLVVGALLVTAATLARRAVERSRPLAGGAIEAMAIAFLAAAAWVKLRPPEKLSGALSLFPPLVRIAPALVVAGALWRVTRRLAGRTGLGVSLRVPDAALLIAAIFSARLLLAAGYVGPYNGFLLPLPLLVATVGLFRATERAAASVGPALPRLLTGAVGIFFLFRITVLSDSFRHPAWARVETPAGSLFLLEPIASTTRLALQDLAARVPPGGSLVGFPEAGFFNYTLGRSNPLPQEQFFPGHLDAAEEEATMHRLAARPPEAIVYCNVVAVGHGSLVFGKDYLRGLDRFVRERFKTAAVFGPGARPDAHIGDPDFFVEVRVPRGRLEANPATRP